MAKMSKEEKRKMGEYWENEVYQFLLDRGNIVTKIICYAEDGVTTVPQHFIDENGYHSKPDFDILNLSKTELFVEVKSSTHVWKEWRLFPLGEDYSPVECVTMLQRQFDDYVLCKEHFQKDVCIVFIPENKCNFYSADVAYLNKTKKDLFTIDDEGNEIQCYLWRISKLTKLNAKFNSRY